LSWTWWLLVGAYNLQQFTWTRFCATGTLSDYRAHSRYHLSSFSDLKPVNEAGEYENGVLGDGEAETIKGARKGRILQITPEVLVNDDLGAFVRITTALGQAAGRTIEKDVYAVLKQNGGLGPVMKDGHTLFHAEHKNIADGAAVSVDGLTVLKTFVDDVMRHHSSALQEAGEAQRAYINRVRDSATELRRQAVSFFDYRDVIIKTTDEVARLGEAERQAYQKRLSGLEQFEALPNGAVDAAAVLETTLLAALEKLNVSADRMGFRFTGAGRDAIAAFGAVAESAVATGTQIEAAFKAALGKVSTLDEARTLGSLLEAAGNQGKIGFDAAGRSAAALNARLRDMQAALNPLADDFAKLGIQSQESLNAARDSAKAAFESIQRGASQGKASIEDVRRAFRAYSDAAQAAVADSDSWRQAQVQSQLQVQGQILQTGQNFRGMGAAGQTAMQQVEGGALAGRAAIIQMTQGVSTATGEVGALG